MIAASKFCGPLITEWGMWCMNHQQILKGKNKNRSVELFSRLKVNNEIFNKGKYFINGNVP